MGKNQTEKTTLSVEVVLAIDPGRTRCGLALVSRQEGVLERRIVPPEALAAAVREMVTRQAPGAVLMGKGTCPRPLKGEVQAALQEAAPGVPFLMVGERHSTERARGRYFRDHPPRGLWRLVPLGLQVPPRPYDDYAAVILAEDYLQSGSSAARASGPVPPNTYSEPGGNRS